jgi:hypothetical protein
MQTDGAAVVVIVNNEYLRNVLFFICIFCFG